MKPFSAKLHIGRKEERLSPVLFMPTNSMSPLVSVFKTWNFSPKQESRRIL
jgi:hypothetical protein